MKLLFIAMLMVMSTSVLAQQTHEYKTIPLKKSDPTTIINAAESSPEDGQAQFNLAAYYYNQGVEQIDQLNGLSSDDELRAIQQNVENLFRNALPSALRAYELNSNSAKTCEMLSGIYFGLNDLGKAEEFSEKAKSLTIH